MDTLFCDVEVMDLMWSRVAIDSSMGRVISCSIASGLAPGSEVTTIT